MRNRRRSMQSSDLDLRYVTERKNKEGTVRRYWQRKGQPLIRLPDDLTWAATASQLNRDADISVNDIVIDGTVSWAVNKYRSSEQFTETADKTKKAYNRGLKDFEERWGKLQCTAITRRVIKAYLEIHKGHKGTQKNLAAVLRNVLTVAHDNGFIEHNPVTRLNLKSNKPRQEIWSQDDIENFLKALSGNPMEWALYRYLMLLQYTGQRPVDIINMKRSQYDGEKIELVQQKTGKLLAVSCHVNLRQMLDADPGRNNSFFFISSNSGKAYSDDYLSKLCRPVLNEIGLGHLQIRDLRRTAVVRLAEAGCEIPELTSITGHSVKTANEIIETYMPRTGKMSANAIRKWEQNG